MSLHRIELDMALALLPVAALAFLVWLIPIAAILYPSTNACPHCGSKDIRASRAETLWDRVRGAFSLHPNRCRSCRKRFYTKVQQTSFRPENS